MGIYEENGFANREAYLRELADDYGVDFATVSALADLLGESEDFDGLLVALEDHS
jgi:hypothetical protein